MPDFPSPDVALPRLQQQVHQTARPLQQAHQRWQRALTEHQWDDARVLLKRTPALVRAALPLDPAEPRTDALSMARDGTDLVTGPLPLWLLQGVAGRQAPAEAQGEVVALLQDWIRLGGSWHLPRDASEHHGLLEALSTDHAQDTALWLTLLRAGWPAQQEGWVLGAILGNPDGWTSARRLRTALAVLDENPGLLRQRGADGSTAWHLLMTTLPGLLNDSREPLAAQLVQRLRTLNAPPLDARSTDDHGQRPVDLCWPETDSPDPQEHEAYPGFPYWSVLQWLSAQPEPFDDANLWALWQRQAELDAPRHHAHPVFQAFAARVEQEIFKRMDLPMAPAPLRVRI